LLPFSPDGALYEKETGRSFLYRGRERIVEKRDTLGPRTSPEPLPASLHGAFQGRPLSTENLAFSVKGVGIPVFFRQRA
jgi:hypothetical protein